MSTDNSRALRSRSSSEILRRGYSDEELRHLYALGRFFLENGDTRRAECIFLGLNEVAPDYLPAWLGTCTVQTILKNFEAAVHAARQGLRADKDSIEALLFLACSLLTVGDYSSAGSHLGEVGERVDAGSVSNPQVVRFYQIQLARYQNR